MGLSVVEDDLSEFIEVLFDEFEGRVCQVEVSLSLGVLLLVAAVFSLAFAFQFDVKSLLELDSADVIGDSLVVVSKDSLVVDDVVGQLLDVAAEVSDVLVCGLFNLVVVVNAFFLSLVFDVLSVLEFIDDLLDHIDDFGDGTLVGLDGWGLEEFSNVGNN